MYEDERVNDLAESVDVFKRMWNAEVLSDSTMILMLNQSDLFREKIEAGVPLSKCPLMEDMEGKEMDYDEALDRVRQEFVKIKDDDESYRQIYTHVCGVCLWVCSLIGHELHRSRVSLTEIMWNVCSMTCDISLSALRWRQLVFCEFWLLFYFVSLEIQIVFGE